MITSYDNSSLGLFAVEIQLPQRMVTLFINNIQLGPFVHYPSSILKDPNSTFGQDIYISFWTFSSPSLVSEPYILW